MMYPSLSRLSANLRRQGLPARYVDRIITELCDHQQDLCESASGSMRAERILGDVDNLGSAIVDGYRQQSFAGRHPVLALVCGPLLFCFVLCFGYVFLVLAFGGVVLPLFAIDFVSETQRPSFVVYGIAAVVFDVLSLLPFVLTAVFTVKLVNVSGRGSAWLVAASAVQIFVALITLMALELSPFPDENSGLHLSIGTDGFEDTVWVMLRQLLQASIPIVIGVVVRLQSFRENRLRTI